MLVYRIGRTRYAHDLTGEGARLFGGRWNHKLTPCIYTSESRALAMLEYTVNVNIEDIPRRLSLSTFEIPDKSIFHIPINKFPGDWMVSPPPSSAKDFGTGLLQKSIHLAIKMPSAILPPEFNLIINPLHKEIGKVILVSVDDFIYDIRVKMK